MKVQDLGSDIYELRLSRARRCVLCAGMRGTRCGYASQAASPVL